MRVLQHARALKELNRMAPASRAYADRVWGSLNEILGRKRTCPPPPTGVKEEHPLLHQGDLEGTLASTPKRRRTSATGL